MSRNRQKIKIIQNPLPTVFLNYFRLEIEKKTRLLGQKLKNDLNFIGFNVRYESKIPKIGLNLF